MLSASGSTSVLDAAAVARNAGLDLRRNGSRLWACCPIHGEKAPSLCFFPDGRFHCFGCGAHGDAADLYAALHGVPLAEALRICRGSDYDPKSRRATAADQTRKKVESWFAEQWAEACRTKHEALAAMSALEGAGVATLDNDAFWACVQRLASAEERIYHLDSVKDDPKGMTLLYMEDMRDKQGTNAK
ncbi:MAG: hypothetical protein IJ354_09290 [Clostridia bacterium]|nr:hypothetical protein [Clostridia bacterium]